jgi:hypothetical protein
MKKPLFLLIYIFIFTYTSSAQDNNNVIITSCGQGETQIDAQQAALRNAISQAFGTFISTKTEILNDELVSDQITSISNGNIQSFEILNESELPNGKWSTILKAVVSVDELTKFVQSKGVTVEIKGGLFAANIKQQQLNERNEIDAVYNLVGVLHDVMQTCFDYQLKASSPKALDVENINWEIPLEITITANKNIEFCASYIYKALHSISMGDIDRDTYLEINKPTYPISLITAKQEIEIEQDRIGIRNRILKQVKEENILFFRNKKTLDILSSFCKIWGFYIFNFTLSTNLGNLNFDKSTYWENYSNGIFNPWFVDNSETNVWQNQLNFNLYNGAKIGQLNFSDFKTITEINELDNYSIKCNQTISTFNTGGVSIPNDSNQEYSSSSQLILAVMDLGYCSKQEAKEKLSNLTIGGYSDWAFPTNSEYRLLKNYNLLSRKNENFWVYHSNSHDIELSVETANSDYLKARLIAVRHSK